MRSSSSVTIRTCEAGDATRLCAEDAGKTRLARSSLASVATPGPCRVGRCFATGVSVGVPGGTSGFRMVICSRSAFLRYEDAGTCGRMSGQACDFPPAGGEEGRGRQQVPDTEIKFPGWLGVSRIRGKRGMETI